MNLAFKDVQHNLGRFSLTALGIGMMLMIVMGMAGIYRGLIEDATLIVIVIDGDLWVAARYTVPCGNIAVPETLVYRVQAVPASSPPANLCFIRSNDSTTGNRCGCPSWG
jgi:putative ABC transport system permease protein